MVLGLETVPHLPCDKKTALVVLLSTICTQEIAVYGVYSTPRVEQERIKTIDILLNLGRQAFAQLHADGESFQKVSRGAEMLDLLERFRIPEPVQIPGGLTAEASISLFRISHCKEALEQLQRWVKRSVTVPKDVSERALKILSYTRHETKQRLKADANTKSYVDEKQIQLRFYGIIEPSQKRSAAYPKSIEREMRRLGRGYGRLQRLFVRNIKSALSQQPVQLSLQEHRQQWAQQQQQELQPLQQQHHSTSQPAENTAVATQPGEQLAMLRSGVGVPPPLPSSPLPAPCQGALPTPTPTFLNSPVPQSSQPPRKDSRQHIPTAPPELPDQLPAHSAPTSQVTQQESRKQQQSSFSSSTSMSGFRAEAPVFRPRGIPQEEAQWDTSNTYPGTVHASWTAPPAPGFASPWQTAGEGTHWPNEPERIDQWEARWLQDPSSQSLPPSGENQEIPPLVDVSLEVPLDSVDRRLSKTPFVSITAFVLEKVQLQLGWVDAGNKQNTPCTLRCPLR
ncbi:hypothetical protein EPH_0019820 [Eimeria praecox]|uniref:Uncharacterized protein n=1 Tax=Eimeria praecox TaxID=51316 RepID=U6H3F2_9EIME|nr:hypothetical protein EPH_0019820 [Eimeria praecox]